MYIAVIGAGGSGLCAARYILEHDHMRCVVFEQNEAVGGTWVYTDYVGKNMHGLPVHSSVYKSLRTNLPKEAMAFPDYSFKKLEESYVSREIVLEYLNSYADHFNLRDHIKLNHYVKSIAPVEKKWSITVVNLIKKEEKTYKFDAVILGTGHNSSPVYPEIEGMKTFNGIQLHSHDYRIPQPFDNKRVLVIGSGPSGFDIAYDLSFVAEKVIWSYHSDRVDHSLFPDILHKPDVKRINGSTIEFEDGTSVCDVEVIIYGTGYKYWYPFLDESCGISTDENYVYPLYKSMLNINHPTMCFLGIPRLAPQFPLFDLQSRWFLKLLSTGLPSKEHMMTDLEKYEKEKRSLDLPKSRYQVLENDKQPEYFDDLAKEADIDPIPDLILKLHKHSTLGIFADFTNFRKNVYKIINKDEFEVRVLDD